MREDEDEWTSAIKAWFQSEDKSETISYSERFREIDLTMRPREQDLRREEEIERKLEKKIQEAKLIEQKYSEIVEQTFKQDTLAKKAEQEILEHYVKITREWLAAYCPQSSSSSSHKG